MRVDDVVWTFVGESDAKGQDNIWNVVDVRERNF